MVTAVMVVMASPPRRMDHVHYSPLYSHILSKDEQGLLQATIFRNVYERYGDLLYQRGAFLLEGRVQNTPKKGFSFLVKNIGDLGEALVVASMPTPMAVRVSGTFLRAGRWSRRAG
jgi:hypothetical protein